MNYWSAMADTGGNRKGVPAEILPGVFVYPDAAEVARGAARHFVDYAWQSIARNGKFMVALSGGTTPRQMFQLLASDEFRGQVDWAKVHFFWSDERAVPPDECREQLRNGAPRIAHSSSGSRGQRASHGGRKTEHRPRGPRIRGSSAGDISNWMTADSRDSI